MCIRDRCNVVNMIHYDELKIRDGIIVPYIIMSKYSKNLKKYKEKKSEVNEEEFKCLVEFLFSTLDSIHKQGIIHRDVYKRQAYNCNYCSNRRNTST